jgi:hypothetical protein
MTCLNIARNDASLLEADWYSREDDDLTCLERLPRVYSKYMRPDKPSQVYLSL